MALSGIKTYFRSVISGVDSGIKEWTDGFNIENIPASVYDKAFHLSYGPIQGDILGAEHQGIDVEFIVRLVFKGYRDVSSGIDRAVDLAESILKAAQDPATRLGNPIKNVKFLSMTIEESFRSNDNLILVTQTYNVKEFLCL